MEQEKTTEQIYAQALRRELNLAGCSVEVIDEVLELALKLGLCSVWSLEAAQEWVALWAPTLRAEDLQRALFVAKARAAAHRENLEFRAALAQALLPQDQPMHDAFWFLLRAAVCFPDRHSAFGGCQQNFDFEFLRLQRLILRLHLSRAQKSGRDLDLEEFFLGP